MSRGRAFGLTLDVDFPCPGLPPAPTGVTGPTVVAELTDEDLAATFPAGGEALSELRGPDGDRVGHVARDGEAGYLLHAQGYGSFVVDRAAAHVRCAPAEAVTWRWQRFLVGQVLPFVAVLHGFEVFHSSMVVIGGSAVAFLGASQAGKSSLALGCALRGARYVADDVVTVEVDRDRVVAHPGFGLTSIRRDLAGQLTAGELRRLGDAVGEDDEAVRIAVDVVDGPVTVASAYFVERRATGPTSIAPCVDRASRLLLASSYNFVLQEPDRLVRQLDVCARLAREVRLFQLTIGPGTSPFDVAQLVAEHEASLLGTR
jgi:hypothetical protein